MHYDPFARGKIPFALRIRGSVLGGMLPTLLLVGIWSSLVVYVGTYHLNLAVDSLLITVTGRYIGNCDTGLKKGFGILFEKLLTSSRECRYGHKFGIGI